MSLLAAAILTIWDRVRGRVRDRLTESFIRLRDAAEPPVGITLQAPDGSVYTGVSVIERNKVILLLAYREYGAPRPTSPTPASPPMNSPFNRPDQSPQYGRTPLSLFDQERHPFDDDEPHWRR